MHKEYDTKGLLYVTITAVALWAIAMGFIYGLGHLAVWLAA